MNTAYKSVFSIAVLLLSFSCKNDETIVNLPPTSVFESIDAVSKFTLDGSQSADPENNALSYKWTSSSSKIEFASATSSTTTFDIPSGNTPFDVDISLEVSDGKKATISKQTLTIPALTDVRVFGLGKQLTQEAANNATIEWYLDQANTGTHSSVNCGPTSVTMAIKWFNPQFTKTPEDARNTYRSEGGWWYTSDITNYLNSYEVPNYIIALPDIDLLKEEVDNGNIIILCLDMYYVDPESNSKYHFNKFYDASSTGWGHFIVIKGYKDVDGKTFFEAYDPYSYNRKYTDNKIKGKDRYYTATNLDIATTNWWDFAIVVSKTKSDNGRRSPLPANVVPMAGR